MTTGEFIFTSFDNLNWFLLSFIGVLYSILSRGVDRAVAD